MLRADVGRVGLARHLLEGDGPVPNALLDPQLSNSQVPDSAYAAPPADPDRRRRVGEERQANGEAQVRCDRLDAKAFTGALHYSA